MNEKWTYEVASFARDSASNFGVSAPSQQKLVLHQYSVFFIDSSFEQEFEFSILIDISINIKMKKLVVIYYRKHCTLFCCSRQKIVRHGGGMSSNLLKFDIVGKGFSQGIRRYRFLWLNFCQS